MASEASKVWTSPGIERWRVPAGGLRLAARAMAILIAVWALVQATAENAVCQMETPATGGSASPKSPEPARLDYVLVQGPEERMAEWWPDGTSDHIRVSPGDFREMLQRARQNLPPAVRSARYEARFENDELVGGQAVLEIDHLGPIEAVLPLSPCNLALGTATWADRDHVLAHLGLAPNGQMELRVPQGGRLDVNWSLRGVRETLGGVAFEIRLPPSPSSRLLLTLPKDRIPVVSAGIVKEPEEGKHVWEVILGGLNQVRLRIAPKDDPEGHSQLTELREDMLYSLSPGGLELTVKMQFDVLGQPLGRLELLVGSELTLISVRDGDRAVPWGDLSATAGAEKRVVLEPEEPIQGLNRELTLTALAKSVRQGEPWRLPRVKVQGVHWRESLASVLVDHPLRLNDVTSENGRILPLRPQAARKSAVGIDVELYSGDARIDVVVGQERMPPKVDYGVLIEMSGGQIQGLQTIVFEAAEEEYFQLAGRVTGPWVVDSIQATPPERIADWRVEPDGESGGQLLVDLAQPLSAESPVELAISARRLETTEGKSYPSRDMIPVEFDSSRPRTALVALHSPEPYQIELSGTDGVVQREPQDLSLREHQLFPDLLAELPRCKIYVHEGDEGLGIQIQPRPSVYSAEIDALVSVSGSQASESYVFRIDPEATRLEEVAVEMMRRPGVPVRWEFTTGDEARLIAGSPDGSSRDGLKLDRWEVRLRPSRSEPFEIRAVRSFPVTDETPIGVARLPEAAGQRGRVSIGISGADPVRVENRSFSPEIPDTSDEGNAIARSVYRYDPEQIDSSGKAPLVLRVDTAPASLPRAWIWLCQLESRLEPTGRGQHVATYRVESAGAPFVHLLLPPSVPVDSIESVEIDGHRAPLESSTTGEGTSLGVRLRGDCRFHEITVCYRTDDAGWSVVQRLKTPVPEPDLPVLKRKWIVWLPPGHQILNTKEMLDFSSSSRRWPRCVLGPVGRAGELQPFDPLASDWWRWPATTRKPGNMAGSPSGGSGSPESEAMDFGALVDRGELAAVWYDLWPEGGKIEPLVDVAAVEAEGVTPQTKISLPSGGNRADQVARLLNQMGLALASSGQHIVVTSIQRAAAHGERLQREGIDVLWKVTDAAWADEIARASSEVSSLLVSPSGWLKLPSQAVSPWQALSRSGYEPRETTGWAAREMDLTSLADATVVVVDRNLVKSCLWGCFLIVGFLTWTVAIRFAWLPLMPMAAFFLGAAYSPDFWTPWLSACFWGSTAGLFLRLGTIRRRESPGRIVGQRSVTDSTSPTRTVLGCLLAAAAIAGEAGAQTPATAVWPESPALILAPLDEDEQPTGYFLPKSFHSQLLEQAESPDWLLREANYEGRLSWQATGDPLTLTEFTAEFALEIARANKPVEIMLGKTVDEWSVEGVWLNDRKVDKEKYTWADGKFVFSPEPADWCQLRLQLQRIPGVGLNENGFHLSIPPLMTSRLRLAIPADAPAVEVPTATGRLMREPLSLEAELGPVDRLTVKWPQTGRANSGRATRVSELLWLNVTLGGALIDAQFQFDVGLDSLSEPVLVLDPRLNQRGKYEVEGARLADVLPEEQPLSSAGHVQARRQRLSLTEVVGPKVIVRCQFQVLGTSGVGNLRLPTLRSEGVEVSQRWVAATVGPMLQYEQTPSGQVSAINVDEFVDAWVGEADPPMVAVQLNSEDASFELGTKPKAPQSTAKWQMSVGYGLNETRYQYRASVDTTQGYLFQHRLAVQPDLVIDEAAATVGDVPVVVRWARPSREQIVLFFDAPVSGRHTVEVRGHVSGKGERRELRAITLQGVTNEPGAIDIYRDHEATVTLESVEGMKDFGPPGDIAADGRQGRIVTRWGVDGQGTVSAIAHVKANIPEVVFHEQVISIRKTPDGWTADFDCRLEVRGGIVDRITIETSKAWPGPYIVSSELIKESIDGERQELVLRPPLRSQLEFSVSGPLVPERGGDISVPRIRLKRLNNVERMDKADRLVVLPVGPIPAIAWDHTGLLPTNVPTRIVAKAPGLAWEAYRVEQDDFRATVRRSPDPAQVCFADVRIGLDQSGEGCVVALLDVEAGDRDWCVLRVPPPWQLVAVSNRGVPQLPQKRGEDTWQIPLGRTALPQRLELVLAGTVPLDERGGARIEAFPQLEGLPIQRSLWTLSGEAQFEVAGAVEPVRREQAAIARLRNVTGLIHRAADRPGCSLEDEPSWYRGWFSQWITAQQDAQAALALVPEATVQAERTELEGLDGERQALVRQLNASAIWEQLAKSSASRIDPGVLWTRMDDRGAARYYFAKDGASPLVLRIDSPRSREGGSLAVSPIMCVSAVLLTLLVFWTTGRIHRWPHLCGTVLGLCWWLWLWPSFFGLLLVAVSLVAALRSDWRRPRSSGSAILRLSPTGRV